MTGFTAIRHGRNSIIAYVQIGFVMRGLYIAEHRGSEIASGSLGVDFASPKRKVWNAKLAKTAISC